MWGVFGSMAAAPRSEPVLQTTRATESTADPAIPVTGDTQPVTGILLIYGLFGLGALVLILALLNAANKSTSIHVHHQEPPDES